MQGVVRFLKTTANYCKCKFTKESSIKKCKSVKIWQNYGHEFVASLFGPPCIEQKLQETKVHENESYQAVSVPGAKVHGNETSPIPPAPMPGSIICIAVLYTLTEIVMLKYRNVVIPVLM